MKINVKNPEAVVKRAFWLAYQACGRAQGMGVFQARDDATEELVWENVRTAGDYPYGGFLDPARPNDAYGDYVFGRMMKLGIQWNADSVTVRGDDDPPRRDYQSWCRQYPTYEALIRAAIADCQ